MGGAVCVCVCVCVCVYVSVVSFPEDFSLSVGKSTSGNPSFPFWWTAFAVIACVTLYTERRQECHLT